MRRRWRAVPSLKLAAALGLTLFALLAAGPSRAQAPLQAPGTWVQNSPSRGPSGRDNAAMAYDAAAQRILLFGGLDASQRVLDDTWTWNGVDATWQQRHPPVSPPPRCCAAMAYDAAAANVVLFGGSGAGAAMLGDTWTWDGRTWTELSPTTSPPARDGAGMVFDAASGTVLLFGGLAADGSLLNDTWRWDGANWTQLAPAASPQPRSAAGLVYDPDTQTTLLFGGCCDTSPNVPPGTYLGDTWTWDGTTWTQQQPRESPSPRNSATAAYDPILGLIVLFGGCGTAPGACRLGDTWLWNPISASWLPEAMQSGPPGRANAAMATDGSTRTILLFGGLETGADGADVYGADSWTWIGSLPPGEP